MKIFSPLPERESVRFRGGYLSQIALSAWIIWVLGSYYFPGYFGRFKPLSLFRDRYVTVMEDDDFLANLDRAEIQEPWSGAVKRSSAYIDDRYMDTLYEHPPAVVSYRATIEGDTVLRFSAAMIQESWDKGGGGVRFKVALQQEGCPESVVFSRYINPKANEEERVWHDEEIDLSQCQGKRAIIKFITEAGHDGDNRWCWAMWGEPHLAARESEEK